VSEPLQRGDAEPGQAEPEGEIESTRSPLSRALAGVAVAEDAILCALLLAMIGLGTAQIALRNLFDSGLVWIGPALRFLLLWTGLLGALAATRRGAHVAIEVLPKRLPRWVACAARLTTHGFTAAVCGLIAYHSARFVLMERAAGTPAFGDVPAWWLQLALPICFGGIALRYIGQAGAEVLRTARTQQRA
jgi:TRAP-type C4-dicarboxylate transport system permease small subunit